MPRTGRVIPDNSIHHVLNRGNRRRVIFQTVGEYDGFMNLVGETVSRVGIRILAACLMPNHFHFVAWPEIGEQLSDFMQRLTTKHVRRHHQDYGTTGLGHVYQGRYKNFMVQSDPHLYRVLRYVEANAARAGLVSHAAEWRWSSAGPRLTPHGQEYLSAWPIPRPENWEQLVDLRPSAGELCAVQRSARKGTPYGEPEWVELMVKAYGLEATTRDAGRARKD